MSYLRRSDLSAFFRVSLHIPFSATVPPYSSRHASVIRIYVDSSISSYVFHQPAFFIEHRHMYTCPTVQGKDPLLTYWLIPYGVFSTSPRVPLSSMNGDSPVLSTTLICSNATTSITESLFCVFINITRSDINFFVSSFVLGQAVTFRKKLILTSFLISSNSTGTV